ncbi:MAG: flagellar hook-basal body complex protein [Planctomycetes bacterium]|nr:flagellar hook-basal body complex protein [Planctomycetota bacterium]
MGLTSALNTSLNGLTLNETTIDVLGNNIANAGTNGFKSSKVLFTTQLSRTLSVGSRPTSTNGGTNPRQIGLGATVSSIARDFSQGSVTNSTSPSDLAIQGDGFFVLDGPDGDVYSRSGNFSLNSTSLLVNAQGLKVQGYDIDDDFNLITTQLSDLVIPLGDLNVAQQTKNVSIKGALLPTGDVGTNGTHYLSEALREISTTNPITAATLLSDVERTATPGALFTVGQTLTFTPRKGSRSLDPVSITITAGSTMNDLLTLMDDAIGIHSGGTIPDDPNKLPAPGQPGVDITAAGQIQVTGNQGTVNEIELAIGDFVSNGSTIPISFLKDASANGESAITDFVIFDSLGAPIVMKMTAVLESRTSTSTNFRWFLESSDDSDPDVVIADGLVQFDSFGLVVVGGSASFTVDRANTAAVSPMQVAMDLTTISGISSASAGSTLSLSSQDGSDPGTLTNFVIDETGIINGVFDNGIIRTLGQVVLSRFANPQGLIETGNGTFGQGVSSGPPFLATPGNFGAGTIRAGAIELSNTDIGRDLVDLIVASTNYRANARVISSVQALVDELLILGR